MELFHRGWCQARLLQSHNRTTLGTRCNEPRPSQREEMGRRRSKGLRISPTTPNIPIETRQLSCAPRILEHPLPSTLPLRLPARTKSTLRTRDQIRPPNGRCCKLASTKETP